MPAPLTFRPSAFAERFFEQTNLDGRDRAIYINMAIQALAFDHYVKTYTQKLSQHIQLRANSDDDPGTLCFFLPELINTLDAETLMHAESPAKTIDGKEWNGVRELTAQINIIFHNSQVNLDNGDSYRLQRVAIEEGMALELIKV
jgi:hypothetical protein